MFPDLHADLYDPRHIEVAESSLVSVHTGQHGFFTDTSLKEVLLKQNRLKKKHVLLIPQQYRLIVLRQSSCICTLVVARESKGFGPTCPVLPSSDIAWRYICSINALTCQMCAGVKTVSATCMCCSDRKGTEQLCQCYSKAVCT